MVGGISKFFHLLAKESLVVALWQTLRINRKLAWKRWQYFYDKNENIYDGYHYLWSSKCCWNSRLVLRVLHGLWSRWEIKILKERCYHSQLPTLLKHIEPDNANMLEVWCLNRFKIHFVQFPFIVSYPNSPRLMRNCKNLFPRLMQKSKYLFK